MIGGSGSDWFRSVGLAGDGGFITAGAWGYLDPDEGPTKAYLVKTSPSGEVLWQKKIGASLKSVFHSVLAVSDGYVAAGYTNAAGGGSFDAYLVKTALNGDTLWEKTFGGTGDDRAYSVEPTSDGGYILAGEVTTDPVKGVVDAFLLKTDSSGNQQWQKAFGSDAGRNGTQVAYSAKPTPDGGYVLAGFTAEQAAGSIDVYLVKTDANGNRSWEKSFGGADNDWASSVSPTSGGYMLAGVSGSKARMWRTNGSGAITWERLYADGMFHSGIETSDGDYMGVGYASMPGGSINAYAAAVDAFSGDLKWEMTFGGGTLSSVYAVVQVPDGGCAIAGVTNAAELSADGQDGYLVKTGPFLPGLRITTVSPRSGQVGMRVTISGTGFGPLRSGSSYVSFGGVRAARYVEWSTSRIVVIVPSMEPGVVRVAVTAAGVTSNGVDFTVTGGDGPASHAFYFAEGYTSDDFQTYLCMGNSGSDEAKAEVTYMFQGADALKRTYSIAARSRATVNVNEVVGPGREVSMKVTSSSARVVAERPVYFNYQGQSALNWDGGHCVVGARSPAKKWYFAEGTTRPGFEEWITVQNPGTYEAGLTFRYMIGGEGERVFTGRVNPHARATFLVKGHIGEGKDASLLLESDRDVVAERPMYFEYRGLQSRTWRGGHCSVGANWPEMEWHFAEGTTRDGFEEWLCLQNPNDGDIEVDASYVFGAGQGEPIGRKYIVRAKERLTVPVNIEVGPGKDVSVTLSSSSQFVAERPLYFEYQGLAANAWDGGHNVMGAIALAEAWFFGEGYTGPGFEEWLCLQNPWEESANLRITYYVAGGSPIVRKWTVPGNSRLTVSVNRDAGAGLEVSTLVESDRPIVAERPMYFEFGGKWSGGHDVLGFPLR